MKRIEQLKEETGFYIDSSNTEATRKEVDFLCETIVLDILSELAMYVDTRIPASSYVNLLKLHMGMK